MNYTSKVIDKKEIPEALRFQVDNHLKFAHIFTFDNGLQFIVCSNSENISVQEALRKIKDKLNDVMRYDGCIDSYYYDYSVENYLDLRSCCDTISYYENKERQRMINDVCDFYGL